MEGSCRINPKKKLVQFQHGEKLYCENSTADNFYCIKSGRVLLSRRNNESQEEILVVANPGELIGIDSMTGHNKYVNSARAYKETTACRISKEELLKQEEKYPEMIVNLLRKWAKKQKAPHFVTE